ncbi:diphosphomevalonate decarboxylase [Winogradskyella sp. PC-19]|uniref:diphosphomevalonate/mevalonate 3,5-bisphosphate decarboxylase family protein n=1 Tax=unclassified Winogradskyella TaxID=2615021 RepID=UPI000B3C258E|nr:MULTISPECIES: diphosphomevalonate decarboxylase [unclassified Winogradskyella]ARV10093.1 diphosphomevalonate decarboxylase [Winogradskyella sp. PC-19]RZN79974.1 MAG: diphosphomevalonate decarboxylase [Winogradskyella sp.]
MTEQDFILKDYKTNVESGKVKWESPSNIALVKYWGKKEHQIPENPSISFTLSNCKTITEVTYTKKEGDDFSFDVIFEDKNNEAFKPKIQTFFERIEAYVPFLRYYHFKIETSNTFPHSSGIASSASGMSALALCLMSIERSLSGVEVSESYFNQKASFLARLGSGSACRSIEGELVVWGNNKSTESSDLFGVKFTEDIHPNFQDYQDAILLVDKGEKQVSSTVGHKLMFGHPFAQKRFEQAHENLAELKDVLISGNQKRFIEIVESEAMTLHAMMMTSMPYFILMKPNTLEIINKIWQFRAESGSNICFTLDAGANVHVLFPKAEQEKVYEFIKTQLVGYCQNGHYICDNVGKGAQKL